MPRATEWGELNYFQIRAMVIISRMLTKGLSLPEADRNRERRLMFQQEETVLRCRKDLTVARPWTGAWQNVTVCGVTEWSAAWYRVQAQPQWVTAVFTWGLVLPDSDHCLAYLYPGFIGPKGKFGGEKSYQSLSHISLCFIKSPVVILVWLWRIVGLFKNFNLVSRNDFLED